MGYQARLVYGQRTMKKSLNLNDSTYRPLLDFVPPPLTSGGTGEVDIYKLPDRTFSFRLKIMRASVAETHSALARIQEVLILARVSPTSTE